jgi:hypothetical protein
MVYHLKFSWELGTKTSEFGQDQLMLSPSQAAGYHLLSLHQQQAHQQGQVQAYQLGPRQCQVRVISSVVEPEPRRNVAPTPISRC